MRRPLPFLAVLAALGTPGSPAGAEEPLLLRIRPPAVEADGAAYARREAVWARSDRRARVAIASVCTGCMRPMPGAGGPPSRRHDLTEIVPESDPRLPRDSTPPVRRLATALATAGVP